MKKILALGLLSAAAAFAAPNQYEVADAKGGVYDTSQGTQFLGWGDYAFDGTTYFGVLLDGEGAPVGGTLVQASQSEQVTLPGVASLINWFAANRSTFNGVAAGRGAAIPEVYLDGVIGPSLATGGFRADLSGCTFRGSPCSNSFDQAIAQGLSGGGEAYRTTFAGGNILLTLVALPQTEVVVPPPPVPEPSSWALFALGLAGLAMAFRRRRA